MFFNHALARQEKYGPTESFRFKGYAVKHEFQPAIYPGGDTHTNRRPRGRPRREATGAEPTRKAAKKGPRKGKSKRTATVNENAVMGNGAANQGPAIQGSVTTNNEAQQPNQGPELITVDAGVIEDLRKLGVDIPLAMNGPAEGPPLYHISREQYDRVRPSTEDGILRLEGDITIDPRLTSAEGPDRAGPNPPRLSGVQFTFQYPTPSGTPSLPDAALLPDTDFEIGRRQSTRVRARAAQLGTAEGGAAPVETRTRRGNKKQ